MKSGFQAEVLTVEERVPAVDGELLALGDCDHRGYRELRVRVGRDVHHGRVADKLHYHTDVLRRRAEHHRRLPDVGGGGGGRGGMSSDEISPSSPPWPSGLKRWNPTLVPVVRARFEPRCGRPHFAPTCNGVCVFVAGTAQRPESVSGRRGPCPVGIPGTLNSRIKFCHSTGIARSGGGVRASTTSYA